MESALNEATLSERSQLLIELLRRQMATFIKQIAQKQAQTEELRRRLASDYDNNLVDVFSLIDLNKKGFIDSTDIQIFLMNHKQYFHQNLIQKLLDRRAYNHQYLTTADLVLPRNKYELLSFNLRTKVKSNLCQQVQMQMITKDVSQILKHQLHNLKFFIDGKNQCMKYALRNGTTLWRIIDKKYQNVLTYQFVKQLLNTFKIEFSFKDWLHFLTFTTECKKQFLNRNEFTRIFNPQQYEKETFQIEIQKIQYPFESHRAQFEIDRNFEQQDLAKRQQRIHLHELIHDKQLDKTGLYTTGKSLFQKTLQAKADILRDTPTTTWKHIVKEEQLPVYELGRKRLLSHKIIGYSNSRNHIKACK